MSKNTKKLGAILADLQSTMQCLSNCINGWEQENKRIDGETWSNNFLSMERNITAARTELALYYREDAEALEK